jgi:hypothetical protein
MANYLVDSRSKRMLSSKAMKWTLGIAAAGLVTVAPATAAHVTHKHLATAKHTLSAKLLAATTKAKTLTHNTVAKTSAKSKHLVAHTAKLHSKSVKKHTPTAKSTTKKPTIDKTAPVMSNM